MPVCHRCCILTTDRTRVIQHIAPTHVLAERQGSKVRTPAGVTDDARIRLTCSILTPNAIATRPPVSSSTVVHPTMGLTNGTNPTSSGRCLSTIVHHVTSALPSRFIASTHATDEVVVRVAANGPERYVRGPCDRRGGPRLPSRISWVVRNVLNQYTGLHGRRWGARVFSARGRLAQPVRARR